MNRRKRTLKMLDKHAEWRARDAAAPGPDLASYDYVVYGTSGGKDSEVQGDVLQELCSELGVAGRLIACHADLGEVEWPGTKELAQRQAERYGHRFEVVSRTGQASKGLCRNEQRIPLYAKGERYGDLLDQVLHRHAQLTGLGVQAPPWPSSDSRWCTSDHKSNPCGALFTRLAAEWRKANPELAKQRPCRILDCLGLRAQESAARAERPQLTQRTRTRNQHVDTWLPIKWWTEVEVWERIVSQVLEYHPAYDLGMPRLSCVFCVFASRDALMIAGEHNPELLDRYVAVEDRVGWSFKQGAPLREIRDALARGERAESADDWAA